MEPQNTPASQPDAVMQAPAPLNIMVVGPGLDVPGGMASVQNHIIRSQIMGMTFYHQSTFEINPKHPPAKVLAKAYANILLTGMVYDVAHVHIDSPDLVAASIWRKLPVIALFALWRVPVVLHTHGGKIDLWAATLKPWLRRLVLGIFRLARVVVVPVQSHAVGWKNLYPHKDVIVVPRVVAVPQSQPIRTLKPEVTVLFLGTLSPRKGINDLLPAFVTARQMAEASGISLRLVLAGDGDVDGVKNWVKGQKLEQHILVHGWADPEAKAKLFAQADMLVLPSYAEALPMAIIEAMAAALPVITTPVGDIPQLISQNVEGYMIQPGNLQHLTGAMVKLATDPETRTAMAHAAYTRAKANHSEAILARILEETYRRLTFKKAKNPAT